MFWTAVNHAASASPGTLAKSIRKLLPAKLPPSLATKPGNLIEVLSKAPDGGVGKTVHQLRWSEKQIIGSYWLVTRTQFKCEGKHGKAWGRLVWKGKRVSDGEQRIRQSLKHTWAEGPSKSLEKSKKSPQ